MIRPQKPKSFRRERKAVTIIAGFKSYEGIVICADTQETVGGAKRNTPKLRFEPSGPVRSPDELAIAFCGAGDGPFIDKLVDEAWVAAQGCTSLDEVCAEIEKSIKEVYRDFGTIYQPGYCPEVDLIYGVKMHRNSRLFSASGPIVNERDEFASGGSGHYMADFIRARMYSHHLSVNQCAVLAAYTLFQAREHVDGCGGESHIAVLREDGVSGRVNNSRIETITKLLQYADYEGSRLIIEIADLEKTDTQFHESMDVVKGLMETIRENHRKEIKQQDETTNNVREILGGGDEEKLDLLGLPLEDEPIESPEES